MAHKIIGATVRAKNRTHGLAPAREWGEPETVVKVVREYDMTIETDKGNWYSNGDYTIVRYASEGAIDQFVAAYGDDWGPTDPNAPQGEDG